MRSLSIKSIALMAAAFLMLFFMSWPAMAQSNSNTQNLKNMVVQNQQGKEIGKVKDVVIGPNGDIQAVIIEKGGVFLGLGQSQQRIPWSELKEGKNQNYLVYAPKPGPKEAVVDLQDLVGKKVKGSQGAELGTIREVVAGTSGEAFAVIAGADNRYYPVEMHQLKISGPNDQNVNAEFNKKKMQIGPSFTAGEWKTLTAEQWQPRVRAYYGGQQQGQQMHKSQPQGSK